MRLGRGVTAVFALCLAALAPDHARGEVVYVIEDVSPPYVQTSSSGLTIENHGIIVGAFYDGTGVEKLFMRSSGGFQNLELAGYACDMNDKGQFTGEYYDPTTGDARPLVWDNGAVHIMEGEIGAGLSISDSGLAVGFLYEPGYEDTMAFAWSPASGFVKWVRDASLSYLSFQDVDDHGNVIGWADAMNHPFLPDGSTPIAWRDYDFDMVMDPVDVKYPTGIWPRDINNSYDLVGSVIGNSRRWVLRSGTIETPIEPPTATSIIAAAYELNDLDQVVGRTRQTDGTYIRHYFLWENGKTTIVDDLPRNDPSWSELRAYDINDHGQMTGYGRIGGVGRAFLMTPLPVLTPELTQASGDVTYDPYGNGAGGYAAGLSGGNEIVGGTATVQNLQLPASGFGTMKLYYGEADLRYRGIAEEGLRLYWRADSQSQWVLAGNPSNLTQNPAATFVAGPETAVCGDWGVNVDGNYVWANVDHASIYGMAGRAAPVPPMSSLGAAGASGATQSMPPAGTGK